MRTVTADERRQWPWPVRDTDATAAAVAATIFWRRKRGQRSRRRLQQQQREERNRGGRPEEEATEGEGSGDVRLLQQERRKGRFSRGKQRRLEERAAVVAGSCQRLRMGGAGGCYDRGTAAEGRKGGSEGPTRAAAAGSGEEAREEGEDSGSGRGRRRWRKREERPAVVAAESKGGSGCDGAGRQ
ncbi:hypothetical protein B296_00012008 [Ensete ventricosum]|uniref:Uncharacterized protein n=1 Tax=Ensete ventricosum TaxID=4639 RepID=A0A426YE69_ENSVE|nr:hypothetical protein B296_00012008 [Ensete ventricosum]